MLIRKMRLLLIFGLLPFVVGLACNAVTGGLLAESIRPSPISPPTLPPEPAELLPSPMAASTSRPPMTSQVPAGSRMGLSSTLYVASGGLFEFYPPEEWEITAEDDASIWIEAPDYSGAIFLEATNTGYELDGASFGRFVEAREAVNFADYENYSVVNSAVDQGNRAASIEKRLNYDGIPQNVISYYYQDGPAILALDFWADDDLVDVYGGMYDNFFNTLTTDTTLVDQMEPYLWIYDFHGPDDLFSIEVPMPWRYEESTGDGAIVNTFYSPDEHAVIQNITYDEGQLISNSDAGEFAIEFLNTYYADDIEITDDQAPQDRSGWLAWNSPGSGFSGNSIFESRGTTFLLFTIMWDDGYEDMYVPILNYTVNTYQVP